MVPRGFGFPARLDPVDSLGDNPRHDSHGGTPTRGNEEQVAPGDSGPSLHPDAARLIQEVRASGEFTEDTWRRLSQAMDDLTDTDLAAVLEEIGRSAAHKPGA